MIASSHKLAVELVKRLNSIMPPMLTVGVTGSRVSLFVDRKFVEGSDAASIIDDEDGRTFRERIEVAVRAVLGGIQDGVMRTVGREWPVDNDGKLAFAGARTDTSRVYLWFGSEDQPAVRLKPIAFDEIA